MVLHVQDELQNNDIVNTVHIHVMKVSIRLEDERRVHSRV